MFKLPTGSHSLASELLLGFICTTALCDQMKRPHTTQTIWNPSITQHTDQRGVRRSNYNFHTRGPNIPFANITEIRSFESRFVTINGLGYAVKERFSTCRPRPKRGHEDLLRGSRNYFKHLLTSNSRPFDKCITSAFFVTSSNTESMPAWSSCYKKRQKSLATRVASLSKKLSDQLNEIIVFRPTYRAGGNIFRIWVKPRKTRKTSKVEDHKDKLGHIQE